jgi:hypothetical protein
MQDMVELLRRSQVATERLLDDDARALVEPDPRQSLDHVLEQRRRDREVEERMIAVLELESEVVEGGVVAVVARHVAQTIDQ